MGIISTLGPRFSPYEDEGRGVNNSDTPDELWPAPSSSQPIQATVELPGSKSLTNRELVLSALASGTSTLRSPLHSRDTELMKSALIALGTRIREVDGQGAFGADWVVTPATELLGSTSIECGLAGTVMRFVPPIAGLALGPVSFDGDEAARTRPMAATIRSLKDVGVDIADDSRGALPFTIHGTGSVRGGEVVIDASKSSQFVSGLLLCASRFDEGISLRHEGSHLPSMPHIEMTIDALAERGVVVETVETGHWRVAPGTISARDVLIEPDLSNAAPFLIAGIVTGGSVSIPNWPHTTT